MKCSCTSAVDHLGRGLPSPILAKTVGAIFRRERIVVDPNVLGSRLLIVPDRNQIVLAAGRLLFACAFTISNPRSEERRVGEESRCRWSPYHLKKKEKVMLR